MELLNKATHFLASKLFFSLAMIWFTVQSIWLAFSAIYPLPFDEYYHWTLTKIYSTQWSPFIATQGPEASILGDITRTPNYLYHYLLSMPYRFFDTFIANEMTLLVLLRLINISLILFGLFAFKRLLKELGVSKIGQHVSIALFTLTPIVPFLSAHLNYDNAQFALFPVFCLLFTRIYKRVFTTNTVLLFIGVSALLGLMKINSLPVVTLTSVISVYIFWQSRGDAQQYLQQWRANTIATRLSLIVLLVLSLGLFSERYLGNIIRYGSPEPACNQIQTVETCRNFAPFARNERASNGELQSSEVFGNPVSYTQHWATKVMRGYYAIFSHVPSEFTDAREPFGPIALRPLLPLPISLGYIAVLGGGVMVLSKLRKQIRDKNTQILLLISSALLISLWTFNYISYLDIGRAFAIQARYTLPIVLLLLGLVSLAFQNTTAWRKKPIIAALLIGLLGYTYSGGIIGYIVRSDSSWLNQKELVIDANGTLREALKTFIIH